MNAVSKYQTHLIQLLTGTLAPRQIVGTGYKYPKSVASAWLRKEIHNKQSSISSFKSLKFLPLKIYLRLPDVASF